MFDITTDFDRKAASSDRIESGVLIRFSPLRLLRAGLPLAVVISAFLIFDYEDLEPSLPRIIRNAACFSVGLAALATLGYSRTYLLLDVRGLTIQYPFHRKQYDWHQIGTFRIERQTMFFIKVADLSGLR